MALWENQEGPQQVFFVILKWRGERDSNLQWQGTMEFLPLDPMWLLDGAVEA